MSKITVVVVEHEGEKLFQTGEIMFDKLEAAYEFIGGSLVIKRQDQVIAHTLSIYEYGTHASLPMFDFAEDGLWMDEKRREKSFLGMFPQLWPEDFQTGDVLEIETVEDFDYVFFLRKFFVMDKTFHRVLTPGKKFTFGWLRRVVIQDLRRDFPKIKKQTVLRFKRQ